jgi:hypothetical protein
MTAFGAQQAFSRGGSRVSNAPHCRRSDARGLTSQIDPEAELPWCGNYRLISERSGRWKEGIPTWNCWSSFNLLLSAGG